MADVFFLDANVLLDYLEKRNQEVMDVVAQLLLFQRKSKIIVATSVFNVVELIDTEFQIRFIGECINERMSGDEILSKLNRDKGMYKEIADTNKEKIATKINDFIVKNQIEILSLSFDESGRHEELYKLIYEKTLRPQDALIVATALANNATYFLSNDKELLDAIGKLLIAFNLRNKEQRETFRDNVLKAI